MKKLRNVLVCGVMTACLMAQCLPAVLAAEAGYETVYTETFATKPASLTEGTAATGHTKYDAAEQNLWAYNDNTVNAGHPATLKLPESYNTDGLRIAFTYKEGSDPAHGRMRVYFQNGNSNVYVMCVQRGNVGLALMNNKSSQLNSGLTRGEVGDTLRAEFQFDFTSGSVSIRNARLVDDEWEWTGWFGPFTENVTNLTAIDRIKFSNEYMACNMRVDDVEISLPTGEVDEPVDKSPVTPPVEEQEAGYTRAFTERFDTKPAGFTDAGAADRYTKWENKCIVSKAPASGGGTIGTYALPAALTDGAKLGFTLLANEGHARLKMLFRNAAGQELNIACPNYREGYLKFTDSGATQHNPNFPQTAYGQPMRVEMKFFPTAGKIGYRAAIPKGDAWEWCEWAVKPMTGAAVSDDRVVTTIALNNEWAVCDIIVDDISVSLPTPAPDTQHVYPTLAQCLPLGALKASTKYTLTVEFENPTDSAASPFVLLNYYDASGTLKAAQGKAVSIEADAAGTCTLEWTTPADVTGCTLRAFAWRDDVSLIPIVAVPVEVRAAQ